AAAGDRGGGLPLPIQATGGRRARHYPYRLGALVAELSRPPALAGAAGTGLEWVPAPEASLEWVAAFDLSYRALEPGHRQFFRRLGLSPCPQISPHAAAALGGCPPAPAGAAIPP